MQSDRNGMAGGIAAATGAAMLAMIGLGLVGAPAHARANIDIDDIDEIDRTAQRGQMPIAQTDRGAETAPIAAAAPAAAAAAILAAQDTSGKAIFHGKGACFACHGQAGVGTPLGPSLADTVWLHVKGGGADSIAALIKRGVAAPKEFPAAMPAMGGAQLTESEVQAVARYVQSLSGAGA